MTGLAFSKQELLTKELANGYMAMRQVTFRGQTISTTPTEIFIDGEDGQRLQPPKGSTFYIEKRVLCWNRTDDASGTGTPEVSTGAGARTTADAITFTEAATHVACDIAAVNTAGTKYLTVTVIGADATDALYWEVTLVIWCQKWPLEGSVIFNEFDGIEK